MARGPTLIAFLFALVAITAAFGLPWHQPDGAEWDDGEHLWGRNIHSTSLLVYELDKDVAQDENGMLLREIAFWSASVGTFLVFMATLFTMADRKAWTLWMGWLGFIAIAGAGTTATLGILAELPFSDFSYGYGFSAMVAATLALFVGSIRAAFLGKSPAAQRRKQLRQATKQARREERAAAKSSNNTA